MKNNKIAIIGGGLSGLLAAYQLSQKNFVVTLFEKEGVLGGELTSIVLSNGRKIEKFYHHLFLNNKETIALMQELGIDNRLRWYSSRVAAIHSNSVYPLSTAKDLFRLPFLPFSTKMRLGLSSIIIPKLNYKNISNTTAKSLVCASCGKKGWKDFWEPMFHLKFDNYSEQISAAWFWGRLKDRVTTRKNGETLGYLDGGFEVLINKLVDQLRQNKVGLKTSQTVKQIARKGSKFIINNESFDKVICALPLPEFINITPITNVEKEKYRKIKHLSVVTVLLETSKPITEYYWLNNLDKDLSFGVIVEQTNLVSPKNYQTHLTYLGRYLDKNNMLYKRPDSEIAELFINDLAKVFPEVKKTIRKYYVFKGNYAQPVVTTSYQVPEFETSMPGLFLLSSAQIYPQDRGIERVIEQVRKFIKHTSDGFD